MAIHLESSDPTHKSLPLADLYYVSWQLNNHRSFMKLVSFYYWDIGCSFSHLGRWGGFLLFSIPFFLQFQDMGLGNPLMKRLIKINVPKIQYIHTLFKPELCTYCGLKTLQTQAWQFLHTKQAWVTKFTSFQSSICSNFHWKNNASFILWFRPGAIGRKSLTLKSYQWT